MEGYKYIQIPSSISFREMQENDCCFAPSKYSRFMPNNNTQYMTLSYLCVESTNKIKFDKQKKYQYSEIGDININNGFVESYHYYGVDLPSKNPKVIRKDDIVISTVRTYRGGIGYITDNGDDQCCSPAMIVIRNVDEIITKEYLFSILRTPFFIEQILGFLNRGMYPRLDKEAMKHILIPIPKNKTALKYITDLTRAYLNKMSLIKQRHSIILQKIERELLDNQLENQFCYDLPTFDEVKNLGRLDTGIYSEKFKEIDFLIKNYRNGFFYIDENNIKSGSTPEVRYIGYQENLKYRWITPTHCSDYGTLSSERINMQVCNNINQNCILLINRTSKGGIGEYVGIAGFYYYDDFGAGHHNQGMYRVLNYQTDKLLFILSFLNCSLMRKYCSRLSVGSKMKELKTEQFLQIPFPNFSEPKQQEIAKLYHNPIEYPTNQFSLENFLELDNQYNEQAGIYELDKTAKYLKNMLNQAIENVIDDKEVNIVFGIL